MEEGDRFTLLDVLYKEVGILGIFSDWPATVTFYANCMNIGLRMRDGEAISVARFDMPPEESEDEMAKGAMMDNGMRRLRV